MQARTITTSEELLKLRAPWEELHCVAKGTLFQHPEWLSAWWEVYGASRRLNVSTFWSDGLLVGILPAFAETKSVAHLHFQRMSFVGEVQVHGEYYPLVEPNYIDEAARHAGNFYLDQLKSGSVDFLDFRGFPPDAPFMQRFMGVLREGAILRYDPENYPHIVVQGPANGDAYLKLLSPKRRRYLRGRFKMLMDMGAEYEVVSKWTGEEAFGELVRLHTARWMQVGQSGRLSRPKVAQFLLKVTERLMTTGNARIHFIRFKGEAVAASLEFKIDRQRYLYLNGRNPTHELARHSVGDVLMLHLMANAFDEGCDCFDMMGGDYRYKLFFGTAKKWYARATAVAAGTRGVKGGLYLGGLALRDGLVRLRRRRDRALSDDRLEPGSK